jgi:hypothetical protein
MIPGANRSDEALPGNSVAKEKEKTLGSRFKRAEGYVEGV